MKINMKAVVTVLTTESRNSNGTTYYNIAVLQDAQAGTINCSQEVFDNVEDMCGYELELTYNGDFKSLKANRVIKRIGYYGGGSAYTAPSDTAPADTRPAGSKTSGGK